MREDATGNDQIMAAGRLRRPGSAQQRAEGHREDRVAGRHDVGDVEFVGVGVQRVVRAGPPADPGRDDSGEDSCGEQQPSGPDYQPAW